MASQEVDVDALIASGFLNRAMDYGSAPSDRSSQPTPSGATGLAGQAAVYRAGYVAMPLAGHSDEIRVGDVRIRQVEGRIATQETFILQRPGWRPLYDKTMYQGWLELQDGLSLTICLLPVVLPDEHLAAPLTRWRDVVRAAVGVLAAALDERIAQRELTEDLIIFDDAGDPVGSLDVARQVRAFPPTKAVLPSDQELLDSLAVLDPSEDRPEFAAARWYLSAAQEGPTASGVVDLCTAVEALLPKPPKGNKSFDANAIATAVEAAGGEPQTLNPPIGRLCGLRAHIVHDGIEEPPLLREGFYALEWIARLLLRDRLGLHTGTWPLEPGETNLFHPGLRMRAQVEENRPVHRLRHATSGLVDENADPRPPSDTQD